MPAQTAVHFSLDMTVNACSSDISLHMHAWRRWVSIGWYLVDAGSTASDIVGAMINEDEPSRRSGGGSARGVGGSSAPGADLPPLDAPPADLTDDSTCTSGAAACRHVLRLHAGHMMPHWCTCAESTVFLGALEACVTCKETRRVYVRRCVQIEQMYIAHILLMKSPGTARFHTPEFVPENRVTRFWKSCTHDFVDFFTISRICAMCEVFGFSSESCSSGLLVPEHAAPPSSRYDPTF